MWANHPEGSLCSIQKSDYSSPFTPLLGGKFYQFIHPELNACNLLMYVEYNQTGQIWPRPPEYSDNLETRSN